MQHSRTPKNQFDIDDDELFPYRIDTDINSLEDPADFIELIDQRDLINTMLSKLSPQEEFVIRGYFGLNTDHEENTFAQIAKKLKVDKELVRQQYASAIAKLRFIINHDSNLGFEK